MVTIVASMPKTAHPKVLTSDIAQMFSVNDKNRYKRTLAHIHLITQIYKLSMNTPFNRNFHSP
jgi:hypothetical protein